MFNYFANAFKKERKKKKQVRELESIQNRFCTPRLKQEKEKEKLSKIKKGSQVGGLTNDNL